VTQCGDAIRFIEPKKEGKEKVGVKNVRGREEVVWKTKGIDTYVMQVMTAPGTGIGQSATSQEQLGTWKEKIVVYLDSEERKRAKVVRNRKGKGRG